ncbi:hypothetical protein BDL97_11G019100 [Sphagnum fallax]|nr:hypothetical protein BDL97_11G019100 [Sphagnum fallax]
MCAHQALSVCVLTASSAPHCSPNHSFGSVIDPKKCSTECPWQWHVLCEGIGFSLVCVVDGIPKKRIVEKLWQEFFSDPSLWWDHKLLKVGSSLVDMCAKYASLKDAFSI